ncbi:MAG: helix-turn-helix domain-containing protein [Bacteriovoracaceae bacterium]|nr:helix-turn-helix domain-containing protein [Bacteriovoracaceae bacterium]
MSTVKRHLNPFEKEELLKEFKTKAWESIEDFCKAHNVGVSTFYKWSKQYAEEGLKGLSKKLGKNTILERQSHDIAAKDYEEEILRLRIENERLKKNYTVQKTPDGKTVFIRLRRRSSRS